MKKFIPLSIPNFIGNEVNYVNEAVSEGWVSTGGAFINRLEDDLAKYLSVPMTVACQSGTSGIHLSLMECGVEPDDHVIVPTLTFIAAVNPVRYLYASPIFMDCDDSLCMDPVKLAKFCKDECEYVNEKLIYIKTKKQIKAVIIVHVFGNLADMQAIMKIASKYHLKVIEDATEALGSVYQTGEHSGKMAGTIADYGVYSFNGNKIITTGGGGAITARNIEKLKHIQYISTQAKDDDLFYIHNEIGYNYRMTNLQAALGVAQLEKLNEFIKIKNENYNIYKEQFKDCKQVRLLPFRENIYSNKWFYSLDLEISKLNISIRELVLKLQARGIQTRPIWGLIHEQKPYKVFSGFQIEKALYYQSRILNIPCSTNLTEEEIHAVTEEIMEILKESYHE